MFRAAVGVSDLHWIWFLSEHWFTEPALQWISLTVSVFYSHSCVYLSSWGLFVCSLQMHYGFSFFFFFFFCFHKNKRIELSFILISYPSAITCSSALIFIIWAPHWTMLFSRPMRNMEDMTSEPLVSSSLMVPLTPGTHSEWPRTSQAIFRLSSSKVCPIFIFIYSCYALKSHWLWSLSGTAHCANMYPARVKTLLSWV